MLSQKVGQLTKDPLISIARQFTAQREEIKERLPSPFEEPFKKKKIPFIGALRVWGPSSGEHVRH